MSDNIWNRLGVQGTVAVLDTRPQAQSWATLLDAARHAHTIARDDDTRHRAATALPRPRTTRESTAA